MAPRWCAADMVEAGSQFRRVNGHLRLPVLRHAATGTSPRSAASLAGADRNTQDLSAA